MHRPPGLVEEREPSRRQRQQRRPLDLLEHLAHLLSCGAVDASVGDRRLPMFQVPVLFLKAGERPPLQRVVLHISHPTFDLALVAWSIRLRRQDHRAVVLTEGQDPGIDLRIVPVGVLHRGFQIIRDYGSGDPAPVPEGVLQTSKELLRPLAEDHLAVALAAVAEHYSQDVRPATTLAGLDHRGALAEVHLGLGTRLALHPTEGQLRRNRQLPHEPPHTVVAAVKSFVSHQVLINPLGRQTPMEFILDHLPESLALADVPGHIPDRMDALGHLRIVWVNQTGGPDRIRTARAVWHRRDAPVASQQSRTLRDGRRHLIAICRWQ